MCASCPVARYFILLEILFTCNFLTLQDSACVQWFAIVLHFLAVSLINCAAARDCQQNEKAHYRALTSLESACSMLGFLLSIFLSRIFSVKQKSIIVEKLTSLCNGMAAIS